jgi:glycosyltransferase involved in cell wall biosynthesis
MYVSIAMTTYNGARYLGEQLDSFLSQTRQPDELVVCDDGSSDATVEILEAFRQKSPFKVFIYRNETNLGYVKNFEKALSHCEGDIVFLSDQDDVWFGNKIEEVEQLFLAKPNVRVILNNQFVTDSNLVPSSYSFLSNINAVGVGESWFVSGCCTTIRKDFFPIILPIPRDAQGHDTWISKLAEALSVKYVFATSLQYHRRHGENSSASFMKKLGKVSSLDLLRKYGIRDARKGWQTDVEHYTNYRKRIFERQHELEEMGLDNAGKAAIKHFSENIEGMKARIEIASLPRSKRLIKIFRFWKNGKYKQFAGTKSAIKDVLRP